MDGWVIGFWILLIVWLITIGSFWGYIKFSAGLFSGEAGLLETARRDGNKENCKTRWSLIESSECPHTTTGSDTTSGSGETPMTQQRCLDTYDTLMLTSSCDDIQIAQTLGIEECSPSGAGKIRINSRPAGEGGSNWAGQGDPVCSSLNNDREADSEGRCDAFYEIHGHPSGFGKKCRPSVAGQDAGTNCAPGDWCIR